MMIFKIICRILIIPLYIGMLIRNHKKWKHLDMDDPNSLVIDHLLSVELWLAALVVVITLG